jgi:arylsulfatase A-like enzyme
MRRAPYLLAIAAVLPWAPACGAPPANVVIVTLDTTRADRLAPFGMMDVPMPHLERLAAEGTTFDRAITASPLTLPSHSTLFTGLLPPAHGVRDNADLPLAASRTTLAEVLGAAGFRTAAFVASAVLAPDRGLAQGFDTYGSVDLAAGRFQRPAGEVVDDAVAWLRSTGGSRFLLWVHLYDPHRPYDPPEPFRSRYSDPYVGEVAFAESQLGRLLDTLREQWLLDRTIVVVAADHGESLGEHGELEHGFSLYDGVVRVPLVMRVPGARPRRVAEVVGLADVMPTVLDLLGVAAPPGDGVSLAGLVKGEHTGLDLEAYSESLYPQRFGSRGLFSLRDARYKLIEAPVPELYDLERDPFEAHDIAGDRPQVVAAMRRRLAVLAGSTQEPLAGAVSRDLRERLAALGYVAPAGPTQPGRASSAVSRTWGRSAADPRRPPP